MKPLSGLERGSFSPASGIVGLTLCILAAMAGPALGAGLEGISYTITPAVEFTRWDEKIGLEDDQLYGGRLSINFGRSAALQGYYLINENIRTNLGALDMTESPGFGMDEQDINVLNYGGDVIFNLSRGPIVPFVMGGGGILRFDPESGEKFSRIGLRAGGGVRFGLFRRFEGVVYVEDSMFRLNRYRFVPQDERSGEIPEDPDSDDLRHNLALGVGVNFFLGGYSGEEDTELDRAIRSPFARGLSGASFPVEPFAGQLQFASDANLDEQELLGVRGGVNFGRLFGLRGFYWRGVDDDFGGTEKIQGWGGEAQFNLSAGTGISPYVVVGAGELDFMKDFRDPDGMSREDKTILILGGGVNVNLSRRFDVSLAARDMIFSKTDLEETGEPDDLVHNMMFTVGLNFSVGGRGVSAGRPAPVEVYEAPPPSETVMAEAAPTETPVAEADTTAMPGEATGPRPEPAATEIPVLTTPVRTFQGDRVVTLPVPTVGEIYIRYGDPGGVHIESKVQGDGVMVAPSQLPAEPTGEAAEEGMDDLRSAIRDAVREEIGEPGEARPVAPTAEEQMELLEARLAERIDRLVERRVQDEVSRTVPPTRTVVVEPGATTTTAGPSSVMKLQRVQFFSGLNADDPQQLILGTRLDLGRISPNSPLSFVPEFELGVIDETSYMVTGNVRWDISSLRVAESISPYISAGFGLLSFSKSVEGRDKSEGVLNLSYGLSKNFGDYIGFIEHQGVDLYSLHRLLVGVALPL